VITGAQLLRDAQAFPAARNLRAVFASLLLPLASRVVADLLVARSHPGSRCRSQQCCRVVASRHHHQHSIIGHFIARAGLASHSANYS
jgi:hypothetical protein